MSAPSSDRNLLFGILALQMDFIDRDALIEAMGVWASRKDRSIGAILVDRGALESADRDLLEPMVERHVQKHGGDPHQSLVAISTIGSVREALEQIPDPDVQASVTAVASMVPEGSADPFGTRSMSVGAPTTGGTRFVILRPHRRGGLGQVYLARDTELDRPVALKEILLQRADEPASRERFVAEAEVTGKLEHPGIVPVYGLGHYADGRPFYAMRFIKGQSLKEAIAAFHDPEAPPAASAERSLRFRGLLNRFLDVCDAIAYAHKRGVLHRDLKPGNVMLGPFGETLVVDWGLAKPLGASNDPDDRDLEPVRLSSLSGSSAETVAGFPIGTPAYASPEQCEGRLDLLGPATDVYGLGAILYSLLTGRAPIEAPARDEILRRSIAGDIPAPRALDPTIPRPLDAICLKSLSRLPADRYPDALALAADLNRWLADEPVAAYPDPLPIRARRWARRHGRFVSAASAATLIALVSLAIVVSIVSASNRRLNAANDQIRNQYAQIARQNAQLAQTNLDLDASRVEAVAERDQSEAVTDFLVSSFRSPDPERDGRTVTIAEVLARSPDDLRASDDLAPATRATILEAIGESYRGLGLVPEAVDVFQEARDIRVEQQGPDHLDTLTSRNHLALAYLDAGRLAEAIPLFESTLEARRATLGEEHSDTLTSRNNLADAYLDAGRLDEAIPLYESTLEARRATLGEEHSDTLTSRNNLADAYLDAGRLDEAIPLYESTLEARRATLGEDRPDTLISRNNLATAYQSAGRLDEAIPLFESTLEARRATLGEDHPATLSSRNNLTLAYQTAGRRDEVIPLYESTLEACRATLGEDHPDTLSSRNNLAAAYLDAGRLDEAIPLYESTLEARRATLGEDHPDTLISRNNLALAYQTAGRLDEAIPLYESTLEARRATLSEDHPATLSSRNNLAAAYRAAGRLDEAIPLYEQAARGLVAKFGDLDLTAINVQNNLIMAYEAAERFGDAEPIYRAMANAAGRRQPRDDGEYAGALARLGLNLLGQEDYDEAAPVLRECLEIRETSQPDEWFTANTRGMLGAALAGLGRFEEAEPMLLDGQQGLAERAEAIPDVVRELRQREAVARLVRLYEDWGKPEQAEGWRRRLPEERGGGPVSPLPEDVFAGSDDGAEPRP